MLSIDICEDDKTQRKELALILNEWIIKSHVQTQVNTFDNALAYLHKDTKDSLLFLDIDMPGMNGIQLKNKLELDGCNARICFCSSHTESILDAFGKNVFGFIKKPYKEQEVFKLADKMYNDYKKKKLTIKLNGKYTVVELNDISHFEAAGRYTKIYGFKEPLLYDKGIDEMELELEGSGFVRIHRKYLVNYGHIRSVSDKIALKSGVILPLARHRKKQCDEQFKKIIFDEMMR